MECILKPEMSNNSSNISEGEAAELPMDSFSLFYYIVSGPLTVLVMGVGLSSNLCCLIIFVTSPGRPYIYFYLITLAVWDILLILSGFLMTCLPTLLFKAPPMEDNNYIYIYPYTMAATASTLAGTLWIVLALTVNQYLALSRPFLYRRIVKNRTALLRNILIISTCSIIYGLPGCFQIYIETKEDGNPCVAEWRGIADKDIYRIGYKLMGKLLFYSVCPFALLFILCLKISVEIQRTQTRRSNLQTRLSRITRIKPKQQPAKMEEERMGKTPSAVKFTTFIYNNYYYSSYSCSLPSLETNEHMKRTNSSPELKSCETNTSSPTPSVRFRLFPLTTQNGSNRSSELVKSLSPISPRKPIWSKPDDSITIEGPETDDKSAPKLYPSKAVAAVQRKQDIILTLTTTEESVSQVATKAVKVPKKRRAKPVNLMLISLALKFLISHTLPTVLDLIEVIIGENRFNSSRSLTVMISISNLLVMINSSTNFWVYIKWSKRFRSEFKAWIRYPESSSTAQSNTPTNLRKSEIGLSICNLPSYVSSPPLGRTGYQNSPTLKGASKASSENSGQFLQLPSVL